MNSREIFGSFFLEGCEFAISVEHVQEVVKSVEAYTKVPLSPDYLMGLFNLRGSVIPVVNLGVLLNLGKSERNPEQKIAILELSGHRIGLLFDRTGEIFTSHAEERSDFSTQTENPVVKGVFKKNDGQRIIQILDPQALFKLERIPQQASSIVRESRLGLRQRKGLRKQCISFLVGPARCSLGIDEIQEILKVEKLNDSALGSGCCIGVIDLRGTTVPVIDFPALLAYRACDTSPEATQGERRIIVIRIENELFGLLVDGVESIVTYYDEDLKRFPVLQSARKEMFAGCISVEGKADILLLSQKAILSKEEAEAMTRGHSQIYQVSKKKTEAKKAGTRRTFITFKVGHLFAVNIGEVKEIIEYPENLLHPPGIPGYCLGVLNLRGDLVTIVDARKMYKVDEERPASSGKVMIFKCEGSQFGLVVDSVEAIVSISDESKVRIPEMLYAKAGGLSEDVAEAILCEDNLGKEQNMLILNSKSIGARLAA